MKTALVTGGTGFIGVHLVNRLVADGWKVRALDLRPERTERQGVEFHQGDIRDPQSVARVTEGCDAVFHLASIPSIARASVSAYEDINANATRHVLEAAVKNGIRNVVHVSSSTVYGIPMTFPLKEEDVASTVGNYGRSKLGAEKVCWEFSDRVNVGIIRPRVVLGAGRIGIFSLLFDAVIGNSTVYMIGNGSNVFQFTSVHDMVDSILLANTLDKSAVYNIGSSDRTPVRDVMKGLIAHAGSKSRVFGIPASVARIGLRTLSLMGMAPLMNEQFEIADKNFMLDTSKAESELGWKAKYSNLDCLVEAFDWYKANRDPSKTQFKRVLGVLGKFRHSQQGAFQDSEKGLSI